jgi:uncharacterized protein (UPF0332 family)
VSPETVDYLETAQRILKRARSEFEMGAYDASARDAYLAALSVTRGIIFDETGIATKTHAGAQAQMFKMLRDGYPIDRAFVEFLRDGFDTKQNLDYGASDEVPRETAERYLQAASDFLAQARNVASRR